MKTPRSSRTPSAAPAAGLSLRLYVAGQLSHSAEAVANLQRLCAHPAAAAVEIVDVLENPARALQDGIMVTPMLVRLSPGPILRIFGTLGDLDQVRTAMGLPPQPTA